MTVLTPFKNRGVISHHVFFKVIKSTNYDGFFQIIFANFDYLIEKLHNDWFKT